MTLEELINGLTELLETMPDLADAPVLFAHQPRWPLQCGVEGPHFVCEEDAELVKLRQQLVDMKASAEYDEEDEKEAEDRIEYLETWRQPVVYLAEASWTPRRTDGEQFSPYAPREAWGEE